MNWCEHLTWEQGSVKSDPLCGVWYFQRTAPRNWQCIVMKNDWVQCPICLTPRPTAPKKLAENLYDVYDKACSWEAVALCAVEEFERLIDEQTHKDGAVRGFCSASILKDYLRKRV